MARNLSSSIELLNIKTKSIMSISTTKSIITGVFLYSTTLFAQEVAGYERIYYSAPESVEQEDVDYSFRNAVAQYDHCKAALTIENNSNDYLLFYGKGPDSWEVSGEKFVHQKHLYSNESFYFIGIG
ncbi:MAG: hypothetical protein ACPGVI_06535, partial [Crocinitomicaceae bacterium]